MAERALLRQNFVDDAAARRRAVHAQFAILLAAAEQRIIAHIKEKILSIDPALSNEARLSAIQRLIAEQADALTQLRLEIRHQKRRALQATRTGSRTRFRRRRREFIDRHIIERAQIHELLGIRAVRRLLPGIPFDATRDFAVRMISSVHTGPLKRGARNSLAPGR